MPFKHGVYVSEQATSLTAPIEGIAGLQVIVGTAPVNLAKNPGTAVNVPKLCYNFKEAVEAVGYCENFDDYTLCGSMAACFNVFNIAPIILINVLDPATNKASMTNEEVTVTGGVATVTKTADAVAAKLFGIIKSTVNVSTTSGGTALTLGTDYTLTFDSDGYLVITLLANTSATSLFVTCDYLDPSTVTDSQVVGSTSGNTETGLQLIRQIYPLYGMVPGLILAPKYSGHATVLAAMEAKCTGINGVFKANCVVDIPCDATSAAASPKTGATVYSDVKTAKDNIGADSCHTIAVWPRAKVGSQKYYLSSLYGALMAFTDANNGDVPSRSPSNLSIGTTAACLDDGTVLAQDQDQANFVNGVGVCTLLNMNGVKAWGNYTACYPSNTDPKDMWISVRRCFDWWGNSFIQTYFQKVDSPANYRLIENIVDSENIRGNSYVQRGYFARCDIGFTEAENPVTNLINGVLTFHQYLTVFVPAQDIENILEFDPYALSTALMGGN